MKTTLQSNDGKQLWRIFKWILGVFFILISIAAFRDSFLSGLFILFSGLLIIPFVSNKLSTKFHIWNNAPVKITIPIIFFLIGALIASNTPEAKSRREQKNAEMGKIKDTKGKAEARKDYVKSFIQNDTSVIMANLNGLARLIDSCRFENKSYTGMYPDNYTTELLDSITGNPVIILDPKFNLEGDDEFLRKTDRGKSLKNYVVRFDFSSNNKNITTSTVITYTNNQSVVFAQNETPNFNHFIDRRKAKDLIETVTITKEVDRRTVEFKKRKEQFEENHGDDAERQLEKKAKEYIGNPSSFEYVEAWLQALNEGKVKVIMRYRYENAFGGVSVADITGYFSDEGKLLEYSEPQPN